jgi:hypothetical protein
MVEVLAAAIHRAMPAAIKRLLGNDFMVYLQWDWFVGRLIQLADVLDIVVARRGWGGAIPHLREAVRYPPARGVTV